MIAPGRHNTYLREDVAAMLSTWHRGDGRETIAGCMAAAIQELSFVENLARSTWESKIPSRSWPELVACYDMAFPAPSASVPEFHARLIEALPSASESDLKSVVRPVIAASSMAEIGLLEFMLRRLSASGVGKTALVGSPKPGKKDVKPKAARSKAAK